MAKKEYSTFPRSLKMEPNYYYVPFCVIINVAKEGSSFEPLIVFPFSAI